MDPLTIILIIAACIGGLLLLGAILQLILATVVSRFARKNLSEFHSRF